MKILFIILLSFSASAQSEPAKLRYPVDFIFEKVLEMKRQKLRPEVPFPPIRYESTTPIKDFQDDIERQWGFRPDRITNAYSLHSNIVYMNDDADYYRRTGRCIDDSLVHELVHYVQHRYQNWDFNDESLEWEAVDIQTAFRETYCTP